MEQESALVFTVDHVLFSFATVSFLIQKRDHHDKVLLQKSMQLA